MSTEIDVLSPAIWRLLKQAEAGALPADDESRRCASAARGVKPPGVKRGRRGHDLVRATRQQSLRSRAHNAANSRDGLTSARHRRSRRRPRWWGRRVA
jgi:hypothetical protein